MLRVIRNHRRAAHGEQRAATRACRCCRCRSTHAAVPDPDLALAARDAWDRALALGEAHGFRNAQTTVIAPTGTIGLVMDCDTTGIEPDFALVKFKKLAGGGYFKIINQMVPPALAPARLRRRTRSSGSCARRSATAPCAMPRPSTTPRCAPGASTDEAIAAVEQALADAFDIRFVFNKWTLGERFCVERLGIAGRAAGRARLLPADRARLLARRDRGRQHLGVRGDDGGGRAGPEARAPAGVRLRHRLRADRHPPPLGREPHPDDGGRPAVHLRRHLQDHQHAARAPPSTTASRPTCWPGTSA